MIQEIQNSNNETNKTCHKIIDKHRQKLNHNKPVPQQEIQDILDEIKDLYSCSFNCSKEVITYIYLLNRTFQGIIDQYPFPDGYNNISSDKIYSFYLNILDHVTYFCTKIINIPQKITNTRTNYIKKELRPFVYKMKLRRYKFFEKGIDKRFDSPILMAFYNFAMNTCSFIVFKAVYRIAHSLSPISRIFFFNKIYYPLVLKSKETTMFGNAFYHLIGFEKNERLKNNEIYYKLHYANIDNQILYKDSVDFDNIFSDFIDDFIPSKKINFNNIKIIKRKDENFEVEIDELLLKNAFHTNKKQFKKQLSVI
jgi:hypothetical protein